MKRRMALALRRDHPGAKAACCLMALAALLRLAYYLPQAPSGLVLWGDLVLPVLSAAVFLWVMALGRHLETGTLAAVALGVVFFLIRARTLAPLHRGLCTVLYLSVLLLFFSTVLGLLPTKKLLYPLFGLPFLYHLLVEDPKLYFFAQPAVPVWHWLPELSVLCIMLGLFCLTFAMETGPVES